MKKIIFFITLFYFIAACSSVKRLERSCKEIPFEELDSLTRANVVLNYKLEVPKEWVKSKFSGGDWYYIQGDYIESLGYHKRKADFYVSKNNIRNDCKAKTDYSVKDFLKYLFEIPLCTICSSCFGLSSSSLYPTESAITDLTFDSIVNRLLAVEILISFLPKPASANSILQLSESTSTML